MRHRGVLGLAAVCLGLVASSCGATAGLAVRADRSATLSLSLELPVAVEAKIRQFASSSLSGQAAKPGPAAPLFDAASVRSALEARGVSVRSSNTPDPRSYQGVFVIPDLERLLEKDRALATVLSYTRGQGRASFGLRVDRQSAWALVTLFPGLDRDLLESLQPPALYDNPVSAPEYRSMLAGLLGKAAAGAIDAARVVLSVSLPGAILESSPGLTLDGSRNTVTVSIPAIEALVLERPIDIRVVWKE